MWVQVLRSRVALFTPPGGGALFRRGLAAGSVIGVLLLLGPSLAQARRPGPPPVAPSAEIESRVQQEVEKALGILEDLRPENLLDSPYLVSAIYYRDGFLRTYPKDRAEAEPNRRIISHISRALSPEKQQAYVEMLRQTYEFCAADPDETNFVAPVPAEPPRPRRRARRRNHNDAVDLFVPFGTSVVSATRGVVILAEGSWRRGEPFSTSSQLGGNTVIVFKPDNEHFYRYAHLDRVAVEPGDFVECGQELGRVGLTGSNAARLRRDAHLHFEINRHDGGRIRPLHARQVGILVRESFLRGKEIRQSADRTAVDGGG
jgi:murein DD-endopeptidase MepM/ murein hydrolase activator NlpD